MAKSIAVLGLGKFGMSLVRSLSEMGADVLAVDKVEAYVQEIANYCSEAICADLANEEDLNKLGLKEMDIVVCAMGESLEASILSVAVAKEQGVPLIVAKSSSARMSSILRKVGANRVIMPEEYAGARSAAMLVSESVLDYFELGSRLSMVEMQISDDRRRNQRRERRMDADRSRASAAGKGEAAGCRGPQEFGQAEESVSRSAAGSVHRMRAVHARMPAGH